MTPAPHVAIIVLNWNRKNDTLATLESLVGLDYPAYEIVVADNGSTDGSIKAIHEHFPEVTLIENSENLGYAEGNNRAVKYALETEVDYVLVLNNDVMLAPDLLSQLVTVAEANQKVGAVGPKIYYHAQPQRIWFVGGKMDWQRGISINLGADQDDTGQFEKAKPVDFLAGCALLVKRDAWERVGPFDPRFFMYWEETDWCARAHRLGYELLVVPQAKMWHKVSSEKQSHSPRILYYMTRNRLLFIFKNLPLPHKITALAGGTWDAFRAAMSFWRDGKTEQGKALARGTFDFYRGRFGQTSTISRR